MLKNLFIFLTVANLSLFLSGCGEVTTKSGISTISHAENYRPIGKKLTAIKVLYQANTLAPKNSNDINIKDAKGIASTGYFDLSKLLAERVPLVFKLNNINTMYELTDSSFMTRNAGSKNQAWNQFKEPVLVLDASIGTESFNKYYGNGYITFTMLMNLYDETTNIYPYWEGSIENTVYYGLSTIKDGHIDAKYVDNMLKVILEQLAKDKVIDLQGNIAIIPH